MRIENMKCLMTAVAVASWTLLAVGEISPGDYGTPRVILPAPAAPARQHLGWPKVVKTNFGLSLVCISSAYHAADPNACEAACVSTDEGATWSSLDYFTYPTAAADWPCKGNLALGTDGTRVILLSMAYNNSPSASGIIGRVSDDGGRTWSYSDTSEITSNKTGSVFGHIISIPGKGLVAFGHYRPPARDPLGGIWMSVSADHGESWSAPTTVLEKSGTVEPDFVYSQGRLIGLIREDKAGGGAYNGYWQIVSEDQGATWSAPVKVMEDPAENAQSAAPCLFEDPAEPGRLYALQTSRRGMHGTSGQTGEIIVWTATASGLAWRKIGTVASFSGVEDWGYASAAPLGNGEWLVVFYAGALNGANGIYGLRCTFDAVQPKEGLIPVGYAALSNGVLSMTADCGADGRLYLASGATDGGDDLNDWDFLMPLQDVSAGDRVAVNTVVPQGAAFARVVLREVARTTETITNACRPYLEGDGSAYLEVDRKLKSTDRVAAEVMGLLDLAGGVDQCGIFGSRANASSLNISALWARTAGSDLYNAGEGGIVCDFNNSDYQTYRQELRGLSLNVRYTIELSAAKRSVAQDGQEIAPLGGNKGACADAAFETATNCRLFDIPNRPNSYWHGFVGRFYSFKIYASGGSTPVRDLKPFMDTDGHAKMRDAVTGAVYANLGSGSFTYGVDVETEERVEELLGPALWWGPCVATGAVPSGSVEPVVGPPEWIEVTPNVCVETGVKLKSDDRVETKFRPLDEAKVFSVFCQRDRNATGSPNRFFLFGVLYDDKLKWNFDYAGQHDNIHAFGSRTANSDYEFACSTNGIFWKVNGGAASKAEYVPTYENFEANSTMGLFASRNATTDEANNFAHLRFYWLRVYNAADELTTEVLPWARTTGGSADNDGCVLVRRYVGGALVSEEEKINESGLNGTIKAVRPDPVMPARQIVASHARDGALVASVTGGAAANLYLEFSERRRGSNPMKWENPVFVTAMTDGSSGCCYSIPVPAGTRYARAFIGTGPTHGDLSEITVISVGPRVSFARMGTVISVQ